MKQLKARTARLPGCTSYTALCDFAPVNYLVLTADGIICEATRAMGRLMGFPRARLIGKKFSRFVSPESRSTFCQLQKELLRGMRKGACELFLRRADGATFPGQVESVRGDAADAAPWLCHCVVTDITERLRADQQLAKDLDAMTRLQKLAGLFVHRGHLKTVLTGILDTAIAIADADFGNIQLLDPATGDLRIIVHRGLPRWWVKYWNSVTKGKGACGTALARGERIIVESVERSPIFAGSPALEMQLKAGVRAVQSTPLISRAGTVLGMFSTHYKTPRRPDDHALQFIDLLARQAADLIEHTQANAALRESERRERSRATELETILRTVPIGLSIAQDSKGFHIRGNRMNEEMYGVPPGAELSKASPNAPRFRVFGGGRELAVTELPMQRAIRGENVAGMELEVLRQDGKRIAVYANAAPMIDEAGHPCGAVGTFLDITERKKLERQLLEIGEREQQRIGHDLHDGLCQEVNGLAYLARLLERELQKELPSRAGEAARLAEVLEHTVQLTRDVIRGLQPVSTVPEGLMLTLRELARRTEELYGVDCRFECRKPVLVHQHGAATHLYRIAQEAVNNAIKHARPSQIWITLVTTAQGIVLRIRDNGVGIPPNKRHSGGMGLQIMKYRADVIHGSLAVQAHPEGGSEIICTVAKQVLFASGTKPEGTKIQSVKLRRRNYPRIEVRNASTPGRFAA